MAMTNTTPSNTTIAIITGGSRGLGRHTALSLSRRGVYSIVTYRSGREAADGVVQEINRLGARGTALQLDVADAAGFPRFVDQVRTVLKDVGARRFQYLVNNAGTGLLKPFLETTEAELDEMYQVHFKSVFLLTQALLPLMDDGGRIVNVSSGLARFTLPGRSAYGAMKGAVEVLTRYLAKELGGRGITVNTVAPGAIATDFGGGVVRDNSEVNQQVAKMTALGRVGVPEDVGPMIAALLSDDNRWVNGQRIEVSGGMNL